MGTPVGGRVTGTSDRGSGRASVSHSFIGPRSLGLTVHFRRYSESPVDGTSDRTVPGSESRYNLS